MIVIRNACSFSKKNQKERDHLLDADADGRWGEFVTALKQQDARVLTWIHLAEGATTARGRLDVLGGRKSGVGECSCGARPGKVDVLSSHQRAGKHGRMLIDGRVSRRKT
jgi:hypothetical protein